MISFPTQAAIQSVSKHEHLASITAANLLVYYISGGIGMWRRFALLVPFAHVD